MDIWEQLYQKAKGQYRPEEVSPFIYARHVVCALQAQDGQIFTGFCIESACNVMNLCAERVAALNMSQQSGQSVVRRLIAFRDRPPFGGGSGMPCGACREFMAQLMPDGYRDIEIMMDCAQNRVVTLGELTPQWWI